PPRLPRSARGDHRDLHSFPTRRSSDLELAHSGRARRARIEQVPRRGSLTVGRRVFAGGPTGSGLIRLGRLGRGLELLGGGQPLRSEEHTSELQSRENLVCRLLLEKKKK